MDIIYSVGAPVPGGGIGNLADRALQAIFTKGYLKQALVLKINNGIPGHLIKEFPYLGLIKSYYWKDLVFDFLVEKNMEEGQIFHGWNNMSLRSLREAKKRGMVTVIERASSFILTQEKLLKEEYKRFNVSYPPIDPRTIKRSLQEYQEADYIFVPSEFAYKSFLENGFPEKKLKLIRFGVDLNRFKPKEKKRDKFRVIFVGQVGLRKGVQYLLQAWKELNLKEAELVLVGPVFPDFKKILQEYKDLPNLVQIHYSNETEKLYQSSSVFVFPTIEEGTALAVLDAMAAGLPVVTTPNAGSPVKNEKDGFLVPIRDVSALKEKILEFYNSPNLIRKMGQSARENVEELSWERYQKELIETYGKIS